MIDNYIKVSSVCSAVQASILFVDFPPDECRAPFSEKVARRMSTLRVVRSSRSESALLVLSWIFHFDSSEPDSLSAASEASRALQESIWAHRLKAIRSWFRRVPWSTLNLVAVGECRLDGEATS